MGLADQFIEIGQRAVGRLDAAVIGGGVTVVAVGTAGDGHQPEATDAQLLQMVKGLCQALEVANPIAVAVAPAAHKDFHESAMLPALGQGTRRHLGGHRTEVQGACACKALHRVSNRAVQALRTRNDDVFMLGCRQGRCRYTVTDCGGSVKASVPLEPTCTSVETGYSAVQLEDATSPLRLTGCAFRP